MSIKLPVYKDEQQTILDIDAFRKASLEDRLNALKPHLTGFVNEKFNEFREKYNEDVNLQSNHGKKNNHIGVIAELEFLERMVFIEKKTVEVLEPERDIPDPNDPDNKVRNPDYKIDGEIVEVKGKESSAGINSFKNALSDSNDQIKRSGYKTITETEEHLPQGKLAIVLVGEELKLSYDEISKGIKSKCSTDYRSIKEVAVYHNYELVRKLQRDEKNRLVEVPPNHVYKHELGEESELVRAKLNLTDPEQLKKLTCQFHLCQENGQNYIVVHKNDRENESLKQLLGLNKEKVHVAKHDELGDDFGQR